MRQQSDKTKRKPQKKSLVKYIVKESSDLMSFLLHIFNGKSRTSIKSLLTNRQIVVDGKIVTKYDYQLQPGQEVFVNPERPQKAVPLKNISIIYEDEHLIVVNKEAGLMSVPSEHNNETSAFDILFQHIKLSNPQNKIYILHRLDREASGILMFAKSLDIKREMQKNWTESVTDRCFYVIVEGLITKDRGTISSWLSENKAFKMYSNPTSNAGKRAITHFKLIETNKKYSLLEVKPETSVKNQIRVHMQDIEHPIVGDKKYGATHNPIHRIGIHSYILSFKHPVTNEQMHFELPVPGEFSALLK